MIRSIFFLVFFLDIICAYGQNKIHIYKLSGSVYIKTGSSWEPLMTHSDIDLHTAVQIRPQGAFLLKQGEDRYKTISSLSQYTVDVSNIVFDRLPTAGKRTTNLIDKVLGEGAVSMMRGKKGIAGGDLPMMFPADNELLLDNRTVTFRWNETAGPYRFMLMDVTNNEHIICSYQANKNSLSLPNTSYCPAFNAFDKRKTYAWCISQGGGMEHFVDISFADPSVAVSIAQDLNIIRQNSGMDKELNYILQARYYIMYKMYSEADKVYSQGLSVLPNSVLLRTCRLELMQGISEKNQR